MKEKYFSYKYLISIIILFTCLFIFSIPSLALIPGDFNGDNVVDFEDLMIYAMAYGSCEGDINWNPACDLNGDGCIEFEDLMIFAMHYGECAPPSAPILSDPGTTLQSPATYAVSWTPVTEAKSYVLQEDNSSSFSGAKEYTLGDTSKDFSHKVSTNTTYYYRVATVNSCGQSGWSNMEDIIINCILPSPPLLSDPGATLQSPAAYTVSWFLLSGASSYVLQEATSSKFTSGLQEYPVTNTSKSFSHTVSTNTTYYYRVASVNSCGQSSWSNIQDVMVVIDPVHNLTKDIYYNTIQAALDDADTNNIIEVADGTYDESITFPSAKKITLRSVNDASSTTIRGNDDSTTVDFQNSLEDTTLEGFTITHNSGENGRGIYISAGFMIIDNCIISGNTAIDGGGIYKWGGTSTITGSTISGNTATIGSGGGIMNHNGTLTIISSTISSNVATANHGGGIESSGTLDITSSTISGNTSHYYGGGIESSGTLDITSSTISGNTADDRGGGIYNNGALDITLSTISNNYAENSGGGINNYGTLDITSSTISGNDASLWGGGIYLGGTETITIGGSGASDISNFNTFTDNKKDGVVSAYQHIRNIEGDCRGSYPYNTYNPN